MSTSPDADFDLEKLFLPAWAKESPQINRYAKYEGDTGPREDRRGDRRDRPPRRPGSPPPRGPGGPQGRPGGGGRPGARPGGRDRGPGGRDRRPGGDRPSGDRPPAPQEPPPEIQVTFTPEDHGVDLLTKQIRMTGRAFPLFDIAQLILAKPERHTVTLSVKRKPDGAPVQPLFLCALDETLWLSDDEAVRHVLERHFTTFYQAERIKIDPPKGVYTFVAQCGMSGVVLGPPNYHDYQNQLRKLHAERFPRMPFDAFKARVKIVKDDEVVKKWIEDQSWKTEYVCLNLPEPLRLNSREEVEKHFRQVHLPNIIKQVETQRLAGPASRELRDRALLRWIRLRWEDQKRFPLQLATVLSQQFAARGLQFFKVNKTVTHVSVARPHFLDLEATPVSDGVRRIVEFINATPKSTPRQLLQALAPAPPAPAAPVPASPSSSEAVPAPEAGAPAGPAPAAAASAPTTTPVVTTPEMAAVLTDLHWLIHQGHVIEFANGVLETAKKPVVKPPPPKPSAPAPAPEAAAGAASVTAAEPGASEASAGIPAAEPAVTSPEPFGEAVAPEAPASNAGTEHAPPV